MSREHRDNLTRVFASLGKEEIYGLARPLATPLSRVREEKQKGTKEEKKQDRVERRMQKMREPDRKETKHSAPHLRFSDGIVAGETHGRAHCG